MCITKDQLVYFCLHDLTFEEDWYWRKTLEDWQNRGIRISVKEMKVVHYRHIEKEGDCQEKEFIQGTTPGSRTRCRPKMTWIVNIKSWTGLLLTELVLCKTDING